MGINDAKGISHRMSIRNIRTRFGHSDTIRTLGHSYRMITRSIRSHKLNKTIRSTRRFYDDSASRSYGIRRQFGVSRRTRANKTIRSPIPNTTIRSLTPNSSQQDDSVSHTEYDDSTFRRSAIRRHKTTSTILGSIIGGEVNDDLNDNHDQDTNRTRIHK